MKPFNMIKINIASDLRRAFIAAVADAQRANPNETNLARVLMAARASVTHVAYKTALAINGITA